MNHFIFGKKGFIEPKSQRIPFGVQGGGKLCKQLNSMLNKNLIILFSGKKMFSVHPNHRGHRLGYKEKEN